METFCTRFGVKKIQLLLEQSLLWNSKLAGVVNIKHMYEKLMRDQEIDPPDNPSFRITPESIDKEVKKKLLKMVDEFDKVSVTWSDMLPEYIEPFNE